MRLRFNIWVFHGIQQHFYRFRISNQELWNLYLFTFVDYNYIVSRILYLHKYFKKINQIEIHDLELWIGFSWMLWTNQWASKIWNLELVSVGCFELTGHALGIWICGCSLFYKRELWASKSDYSTKSLKISGCKRWCPKDLRVRAPVLTHSLEHILICCTTELFRDQHCKLT